MIKPDYVAVYEFQSPVDINPVILSPAEDFLLISDGKASRFLTANAQFNDSMKHNFAVRNPGINNPTSQEQVQEVFEKYRAESSRWKKKENSKYEVLKSFGEGLVKNKLFPQFPYQHLEFPFLNSWQIQDTFATIAGLDCQRATIHYGGRDYTAWFAPGVPVADGPYVFCGLPGLIVEVADRRGWYTFRLKSLNLKPEKRFFKDDFINPNSQQISRESYVSQTEKFKRDPRMFGERNVSEEFLLRKRREYASQYHLLIERL